MNNKVRLAVLLVCGGGIMAAQKAPPVKLVQHDTTIDVQVDGKPFTTYHFNDNYFFTPVRPFLYPVLTSDGTGITTDQQQTDPAHGYQRSIWVGHGDVNGTNHWKFKIDPLAKQQHVKFDWVKADSFQEELIWTDKEGKPMLHETRTLKFRAYADGVRGIEFTMALTPVAADVVFGTHGDRGLLSVRLLESLYHSPKFTSAEGTNSCEVPPPPKPKKGAPAETAAAGPVLPAVHTAWCDESGEVKGATYGAAIFDGPGNPRHAPLWHARPDARLATDMFSLDKTGGDRQGAWTIPAGKTETLRYEVLVHKGLAADANLKEKYSEFIHQK